MISYTSLHEINALITNYIDKGQQKVAEVSIGVGLENNNKALQQAMLEKLPKELAYYATTFSKAASNILLPY